MTDGNSNTVSNSIQSSLFENVDWDNANVIQMEADLEVELDMIEADIVAALIDSGSRVDRFLPALRRSEDEISAFENLLNNYAKRLSVMGTEVHEIERVNHSLTLRQNNQQRLLDTLNTLFGSVNLSQRHIQTLESFCDQNMKNDEQVALSLRELHGFISMPREDGLEKLQAVRERQDFHTKLYMRVIDTINKLLSRQFLPVPGKNSQASATADAGDPPSGSILPVRLNVLDALVLHIIVNKRVISTIRELDPQKGIAILAIYRKGIGQQLSAEFEKTVKSILNFRLLVNSDSAKSYLFNAILNSSFPTNSEKLFTPQAKGGSVLNSKLSSYNFLKLQLESLSNQKSNSIDIELKAILSNTDILLTADQSLHYLLCLFGGCIHEQLILLQDCFSMGPSEVQFQDDNKQIVNVTEYQWLGQFNHDGKPEIQLLHKLFEPLFEKVIMNLFVSEILGNLDMQSQVVNLLVVVDTRLASCKDSYPIMKVLLLRLRERLVIQFDAFIKNQLSFIEGRRFARGKRFGVIPPVVIFSEFIFYMLNLIASHQENIVTMKIANDTSSGKGSNFIGTNSLAIVAVRDLVSNSFEKISLSIFRCLDTMVNEARGGLDEKERINAAVTCIINEDYLIEKLEEATFSSKNTTLSKILHSLRDRFNILLENYSRLSVQRVFPRTITFFDGLRSSIEGGSIPAEEASFNPAYSKGNVKRCLTNLTIKEVRKAFDMLHLRVLKHFDESASLKKLIWFSMKEFVAKLISGYHSLIDAVYPASGITFPYTPDSLVAILSEYDGSIEATVGSAGSNRLSADSSTAISPI